jgi:putative transposase
MRFKGYRFPTDLILLSVRWYLRYSLSYRDLEEMLEERGAFLDHTTVFRWVIRFTPMLLAAFKKRKAPVGGRWRMDETYVKVNGRDRYLYRAVDKAGDTVDFLLTAHRDRDAARRFLEKATGQNGVPTLINIDKSGANKAGIEDYNESHCDAAPVEVRQCKYLNNIVEQDHRNIKRRIRPMLGFKSFWTARVVLAGIELVHMLRKGQLAAEGDKTPLTAAAAFYGLAV